MLTAKGVNTPLRAVAVAAGDGGVSAAITSTGSLVTWGKLSHAAMLGHGAGLLSARNPFVVEALEGAPVAQVSLGSKHAAAVLSMPPTL